MSNDCNVEYNLLVNIILCMQKNHIFKDRLTAKGKKGRQGGKEGEQICPSGEFVCLLNCSVVKVPLLIDQSSTTDFHVLGTFEDSVS